MGNSNERGLPATVGVKIDRIGDIDMLEELRDTISDLRLHTCPLPAVLEGISPEISTELPSPGFFKNAFYDLRSPISDDHINSSISPSKEESTQFDR
jgi:hypothetical protein